MKLLRKIIGNLRAEPTNAKFGDLNRTKITKKLNEPALRLLFAVGFAPSADGQRLRWPHTMDNRERVADVDDADTSPAPEKKTRKKTTK